MPDVALGYGAGLMAVAFFGSCCLPAKAYDSGNGIFYQWMMCCGIFMSGLVLEILLGFPQVQCAEYALFGGAIWCCGNALSVPIIRRIGMGLGLSIWGISGLLCGYLTGLFGLMGVEQARVANMPLNVGGALLAVCCMLAYINVEPEREREEERSRDDAEERSRNFHSVREQPKFASSYSALSEASRLTSRADCVDPEHGCGRDTRLLAPGDAASCRRRLEGVAMAVVSGLFYGTSGNPVLWIMNQKQQDGATPLYDQNILHYAFWHFCGIFLMSTVIMMGYALKTRNQPKVNPELMAPAFLGGIMWAIAQLGWFVANKELGLCVAMPLTSSGPGIVACLWGVFLFGEIRGRRNYALLLAAFALLTCACLMIAQSMEA